MLQTDSAGLEGIFITLQPEINGAKLDNEHIHLIQALVQVRVSVHVLCEMCVRLCDFVTIQAMREPAF